jgi:tetratricopeptide (TPR) repeat protein
VLQLTNRYLVNRSGRSVASRVGPGFWLIGPLVGGPVVGIVGGLVGSLIYLDVVIALSALLGLGMFFGGIVMAWVFLLTGASDVARAAELWLAGDTAAAIPLCHRPLQRVFRADIRMRAIYTLGLCAEADGAFAEADDLFRRAFDAIPAMAAQKWKRRGQCLMLSHRAIALIASGRMDEADAVVRMASALFPPVAPGVLDALTDDAAFGAVGVSAALRDLEPGREPRVHLALSSAVVLAARGMARESLELVERERQFLVPGLLPRERALLENVEVRARGLLAGGPMRSPGLAPATSDLAVASWAERILPTRA